MHLPLLTCPLQQELGLLVKTPPKPHDDPSGKRQPPLNWRPQQPEKRLTPAGRQMCSVHVKPTGLQIGSNPAHSGADQHRSPRAALVARVHRRPKQLPEQQSESYSHQSLSLWQHLLPASPTKPSQQLLTAVEPRLPQPGAVLQMPLCGPPSAGSQKPLVH